MGGWPAFVKEWDGQFFRKNGWPMLLTYVEANALNTSGAHNELPKWGRWGAGPIWGGAAGGRPHYVFRLY